MEVRFDAKQLRKFRRQLREAKPSAPEWQREFARVNKRAGDRIGQATQARANTRQLAAAARQVKGSASAKGPRVRVASSGRVPYALAAIWGMKRRTGWYAAPRYARSSGRQAPMWVGSSWDVGDPGEGPGRGPYALGPALHDELERVREDWAEMVEDLMTRFSGR